MEGSVALEVWYLLAYIGMVWSVVIIGYNSDSDMP